jgi:hypothetical protein
MRTWLSSVSDKHAAFKANRFSNFCFLERPNWSILMHVHANGNREAIDHA